MTIKNALHLTLLSFMVMLAEQSITSYYIIQLKTWRALISPTALMVRGQQNNLTVLLGSAADHRFDNPLSIHKSKDFLEITYPDTKVTISTQEDRLHIYFELIQPGTIAWPQCGLDSLYKAVMYPDGEGMYIPLDDPFWVPRLHNDTCNTLSIPCFGYELLNNQTIGFILHTDLRNKLQFFASKGKLHTILLHTCCSLDAAYDYEISISFTGTSPIGPALHYKQYLQKQGRYVSLQEKAKNNPAIKRLFGAPHVYIWGDGRTLEFLYFMHNIGITNLWIGYETDLPCAVSETSFQVDKAFIAQAIKLGYLVGPYDEFHTMMDPAQADCPNVIFEGMWPTGAIVDSNGHKQTGFAGRGYHISSQALRLCNNAPIYKRIETFLSTGINSYFLDCDAAGELFDDYSQDHCMNQYQDRENRFMRMTYLSDIKKMVLGSESVVAWAVPALAFSHGTFAVNNSAHSPLTKDRPYGGWYPKHRPAIFFKPVQATDKYNMLYRYDPRYRLPLFQTVFHEAIITTDHWEFPHMKFTNLIHVRELLELLYGIPSIWSLDLKAAHEHAPKLKKLFSFFNCLHKAIATEPLTSFRWLSNDRKIQEIVFGSLAVLTANFSDHVYKDIPPYSLQVVWLQESTREIYTP